MTIDTMALNVIAMSGSLRKASTNTGLLRAAAAHTATMETPVKFTIIDIGDLPLYNQDIDVQDAPLPAVAAFQKEIEAADAFIIACPEHNYSVSSALKNALDRGPPSFWAGKATGIVDCWCWRWCGNWARSTCTPPNWCISGLSFCQCARSSNCPLQ